MADQTTPSSPPTGVPDSQACRSRGRGRRVAFLVLFAIASGLVGAVATGAIAQGFGPPGWHRGGFNWMDPAAVDQRIERGIKHLAIEIDASKDQQDKLIAIAKSAVNDLRPMRERAQGTRRQALDLLVQPTVDRAAVEKLRTEQMTMAEEASRRIAKAIGDAAEVLTPEQRRAIADRIPPPGAWRHPWYRG